MKIEPVYSQQTLEQFPEWEEHRIDFINGNSDGWSIRDSDQLFNLNDDVMTDLGSWHGACINILSDIDILESYWTHLSDRMDETIMEVDSKLLQDFICKNLNILERSYKSDTDINSIGEFREWAFYDWTKLVGGRLIQIRTYTDLVKIILLDRSLLIRYSTQLAETANNMPTSTEIIASQNMLKIFINSSFEIENELPFPPKNFDLSTGKAYST